MKLVSKLALLLMVLPATLFAQPGVRMSADFLPLEVGNRWVYDVFDEAGQKIGNVEFGVQEYRIVAGRSFYLLTHFPFVTDGDAIKFVRYDRQERTYVRMLDNEEGPLFLADGTRVEVLQADSSGLSQKFVLYGDLVDLTFQRGMGIVEARMHAGKDVQIAKLNTLRTSERRATEMAGNGVPVQSPPAQPSQQPQQQPKPRPPVSPTGRKEVENVAKASDETVALDVEATSVPGGTKLVLKVINTTDKLVPLNFTSGQTYDFAIMDANGQEIWRWSRRMYFTHVVREDSLRPNRNWTYEVTWNHRDNDLNVVGPGKYTVVGSLASHPPMASLPVAFEIR